MTAVEKVTRVLETVPGLQLAVLFGSTARGTGRNNSDLDIGVTLVPDVEIARERVSARWLGFGGQCRVWLPARDAGGNRQPRVAFQ